MTMPVIPTWERLGYAGKPVGVDRANNVIRGYVVAQRGPFKSQGRGEFDDASLAQIVSLMAAKPAGLKSRFTHPNMSNDGLGKFLGRSKAPYLDGDRVRADLHLDPSSFSTPSGNLGKYVMDLAENDADAISSSLVLRVKQEVRLNTDGTRAKNEKGEPLPPLWRPEALHASDIVETGDAVDSLLSAGVDVDGLPLAALWRGSEMLDQLFADQPREVIEARLKGFLERYLTGRFGVPEAGGPTRGEIEDSLRRARLMEADGRRP